MPDLDASFFLHCPSCRCSPNLSVCPALHSLSLEEANSKECAECGGDSLFAERASSINVR